jgi:hypothetical protein
MTQILSSKFKEIPCEIPVLLLGIFAATKELWWMNEA